MKKTLFTIGTALFLGFNAVAGGIIIQISSNSENARAATLDHYYNPEIGGGEYEIGERVMITVIPPDPYYYYYHNECSYKFIGWEENGKIVSTERRYEFEAISNRHLIAKFETPTPALISLSTFDYGHYLKVDGQDVGNPKGICAKKGEPITLTATGGIIDTKLAAWKENGEIVSTDSDYTFTVTEDRNLVAVFEILDPKITVSAIPANAGTVNGAGTYLRGEIAEATATAKTGYEFVNWQENGVVVSRNARYLFTVAQSRNLIATFRETETDISDIIIPADKGIAVVPEEQSARVAWNAVENATGYTLVINNSNSELVCSLEFDANGRLESLTFGVGLKSQDNVFGVRVTNLSENTTYNYTMEVIGKNDVVLDTKTGTFTTKGGSNVGIEDTLPATSQPSIVGYYSLTGAKLAQEPKQGMYIILYDNGTSERRVK